jgi:nitrate reductase gamma subunit
MGKREMTVKKVLFPLGAVVVLILLAVIGFQFAALQYFLLIILPYICGIVFIVGFVYRVVRWAQAPVPFNIPTVCGQEQSLSWIKQDKQGSPSNYLQLTGRMLMEIFFFRSLFRNSKVEQTGPVKLVYGGNRWLWLGGLAFHWSLLVILLRHLRFFTEPVFALSIWLADLDGIFQLAIPTLFITDFVILTAVTYLFIRRVSFPQARFISLPSDYLALFLILGVAISGVLMRSIFKVDLIAVKELAISIISFKPAITGTMGLPFYIHIILVSALIAYFPFSKMMHAPGVLLSPTRNMLNNSRKNRHINPWNHPVRVHTYAEYEDEFRAPMKKAGLPLENDQAGNQ